MSYRSETSGLPVGGKPPPPSGGEETFRADLGAKGSLTPVPWGRLPENGLISQAQARGLQQYGQALREPLLILTVHWRETHEWVCIWGTQSSSWGTESLRIQLLQ